MSRNCFFIIIQPRQPEILGEDFGFQYSDQCPEVPFIYRQLYLTVRELTDTMNELEQRATDHDSEVAIFKVNRYNGEDADAFNKGLGDVPRILNKLNPNRIIRPRTVIPALVSHLFDGRTTKLRISPRNQRRLDAKGGGES